MIPFPQSLTCQSCIPTKCSQFFSCGSDFSWSLLHSSEKSYISQKFPIFSKCHMSNFLQLFPKSFSKRISKVLKNSQKLSNMRFPAVRSNFSILLKNYFLKNSQTFSKILKFSQKYFGLNFLKISYFLKFGAPIPSDNFAILLMNSQNPPALLSSSQLMIFWPKLLSHPPSPYLA